MILKELQSDASCSSASNEIRHDWAVVADWIDYQSGDLTLAQSQKLAKAWTAYLAIGVAPSAVLQSTFSHFSEQSGEEDKKDRGPTNIMDVFDRLLADDEKITAKRAADLKIEQERLRPIVDELNRRRQPSWRRRQPPFVRNCIFLSIVWATFIFLYALFFDPFDTGGWSHMDEAETTQFALIVLAPVGVSIVLYAYRRWVR